MIKIIFVIVLDIYLRLYEYLYFSTVLGYMSDSYNYIFNYSRAVFALT